MKFTSIACAVCCLSLLITPLADAQTDVIAFWDFGVNFDFGDGADGPNKQDFPANMFGVDNTASNNANFQAFLGNAANLDDNGGGGFRAYTSPVSGVTYGTSRTVKWDDLAGQGVNFDIGGTTLFNAIRSTGGLVEQIDFGNDALIYLTFDATGFQDLQFRFDVEGTPGQPDPLNPTAPIVDTLPNEFDVFIRTTGAGGTWFRPDSLNNVDIDFFDYIPADPENQFGETGYVSLGPDLDNASQVEIIIGDFDGNGEMEIDNFEIVGDVFQSVLIGDVNMDGFVDFSDIGPFIQLLSSGVFLQEADINGDGAVDFADIGPFIDLLSAQ